MKTTGFYLVVGGGASNSVAKAELLNTETFAFRAFYLVHRYSPPAARIESSKNRFLGWTEICVDHNGQPRVAGLLPAASSREVPFSNVFARCLQVDQCIPPAVRPATIQFHIRWLRGPGSVNQMLCVISKRSAVIHRSNINAKTQFLQAEFLLFTFEPDASIAHDVQATGHKADDRSEEFRGDEIHCP